MKEKRDGEKEDNHLSKVLFSAIKSCTGVDFISSTSEGLPGKQSEKGSPHSLLYPPEKHREPPAVE